ncbi:MAG: N-acetylmuramoyl-L-alanine amidase [Pseudomonadota bacterium]|nr:N-acetylmuramoyl-L-alanine amidase [Pseudomonadota bacterium]
MRVNGSTVQRYLLGLALLAALAWNLAYASEIKGLQLSSGATGTRAEIALDREAEFKIIRLSGPDRLVVDLPAATLASGLRMPAASGIVKAIRTGQPTPGTARIVFDLAQPIAVLKPHIEHGASGPRLVLEWPGDGVAATTAVAASPASVSTAAGTTAPAVAASGPHQSETGGIDQAAASAAATSRLITEIAARVSAGTAQPGATVAASAAPTNVPTNLPTNTALPSVTPDYGVPTTVATGVPTRIATGVPAGVPVAPAQPAASTASGKSLQPVMGGVGMRPLIIAIDAGHGGQDPGAIGQGGKREKDITLSIARELARQINATPGLQAYLTRDNDVFIPLSQRAKLARKARADMFVSIHADAAENRNAKGSSVYVLSLKGASSQRARWLADKENAADLIGGGAQAQANNTLASVLLDLTQSGHMKASEDAASHVLSGLKRVGNNHKPHVERANFAVLRTSDMPSMLVETAFLSNPEEELRLMDPAFQRTIARAVLDGVNTYFIQQPPPGTMYAARAQAQYAAGVDEGAAGGSP